MAEAADRALVMAFDRYIHAAMDRYGSLLCPIAYEALSEGLEEVIECRRDRWLVGLGLAGPKPAIEPGPPLRERAKQPLDPDLVEKMDRAGLTPEQRALVSGFATSGKLEEAIDGAFERIAAAEAKMTRFEQHVLLGAHGLMCFVGSELRALPFEDKAGCERSIMDYLEMLLACGISSVYGDLIETQNEQNSDFIWVAIAYRRVSRSFSATDADTFAIYYRERAELVDVAKRRGVSRDVEMAAHCDFLRRVGRGLEEEARGLGVPSAVFKKPRTAEVVAWIRAVAAREFQPTHRTARPEPS